MFFIKKPDWLNRSSTWLYRFYRAASVNTVYIKNHGIATEIIVADLD